MIFLINCGGNLYEQPDYEYVHQELKRVGVTLKLLWQEYHRINVKPPV